MGEGEDGAVKCAIKAEFHLARAAVASTDAARKANLDLAAIYAALAERLRWTQAH